MESKWLILVGMMLVMVVKVASQHDYGDALTKSILFFEGQRSGKLPSNQRLNWRKDSALHDGFDKRVDLVGGYYDAGDNVKYNFPMAFSTTMLAWSVLEFGKFMGSDYQHALDAIRWGTDFFLKATSIPDVVFVQVGDPWADHSCWERPEDMDTARTSYAVNKKNPGSEVSAEIAAALAASSIVFKDTDPQYSAKLLKRSFKVFKFADKYRGSYNDSLGQWVCPFYCDWSGYMDELIWGAAWLHKATNAPYYLNYITSNHHYLETMTKTNDDGKPSANGENFAEFGWDSKFAGINVLVSKMTSNWANNPFIYTADMFICSVLPESPTKLVTYSKGGLLFKPGGSNMQHPTALSFLLLSYAQDLWATKRVVHCGNVVATPSRLAEVAKSQVDYILGSNPLGMSYMVGYGNKFPQKIHHRGSTLPSVDTHPQPILCKGGTPYFNSPNPNPNWLIGALVGGPAPDDSYEDSRANFVQSEPTTYINAPLVGLLAYFKSY